MRSQNLTKYDNLERLEHFYESITSISVMIISAAHTRDNLVGSQVGSHWPKATCTSVFPFPAPGPGRLLEILPSSGTSEACLYPGYPYCMKHSLTRDSAGPLPFSLSGGHSDFTFY